MQQNILILSNEARNWDPATFKSNVLKECNLTVDDYIKNSQWVGEGNENCTDPKILRNRVMAQIEDMGIEKFKVQTYDQNIHILYPNNSLIWNTVPYLDTRKACHTMKVPNELVELGIFRITIECNDHKDILLFVHEQGSLFSDMPDSSPYISYVSKGYHIPVGHEIVRLQTYNGEKCTNDPNYRLNECILDYMMKVKSFII